MIPLVGFAPDLPPETPGVMTDCANVLPGISEFIPAPSKMDSGLGALSGTCIGFAVVRKNDNTSRTFAGTADTLYEGSTTWTDVSKVGGYSVGVDDRWRFAQFGNMTIAAAKSETLQGNSGVDFDDLSASAPKAAIVETINNQVFAFNTDDPGFGDDPSRWWCSAVGDETDWVPAVATQCVSGQLLGAPGAITAGRRLGDIIVAYKERAMFVGQYVGVPQVWDFRQVPGNIGTPCQEAVVTTGTAHYFIGNDDFYVFDGTRPTPLNSPVRDWFFDNLDGKYAYKIIGSYDPINKRIFWWFPTASSLGVPNKCIVLNVKTGQWGRMDGSIEAAAEFVSSGITYDSLGTLYSTYDDLPTSISYNSPFWTSSGSVLSAFGTDHIAYTYSGAPMTSSITTGHHGDNQVFSTLSRVKPRFLASPTSSTLLYSYSNTDASTFTQNITSTYNFGWYDVLWSAMWHKLEMQFVGDYRISGYDLTLTQDGMQ